MAKQWVWRWYGFAVVEVVVWEGKGRLGGFGGVDWFDQGGGLVVVWA